MGAAKIDIYAYWQEPPPERTARCEAWLARIAGGWRPNKRVGKMGYAEASEFFGVYIWEYRNVIRPALDVADARPATG
jgi:hypothetical protein